MALPAQYMHADFHIQCVHGLRTFRLHYDIHIDGNMPSHYNHVQAFANACMAHLGPVLKEVLPVNHSIKRVVAKVHTGGGSFDIEAPSTVAEIEGNVAVPVDTLGAGPDVLPEELALIVRKITGQAGREHRGRIFIPGLHENVQESGTVEGEYIETCIDIAEKMTDPVAVEVTDDEGGAPDLDASYALRHYNRKGNILEPVVKCLVVETIGTRRDRRAPLRLNVLVPEA